MPRSSRIARRKSSEPSRRKRERLWFPSFFEPTTMSLVSSRSSAVGTKERSTERSMSSEIRKGWRGGRTPGRRARRRAAGGERTSPLEAAREVDAECGGRVGRAVRADYDLVVAPEPVQEVEQALGVVDPSL